MPTITVEEALAGTDIVINDNGRAAAAASKPVALSNEDKTAVDAAVTALQIIDDWDESDRAKANIIVGQAGITAGAGAVAANTPRMTLASDDPAVAALATLNTALDTVETKLAAIQAAAEDTTTPVNAVGYIAKIAVTPTVEATPDYSTGDVIGGKMTFAAITRADTKTAYVTAIRIYSKSDITVPIDVLFFNADPSATTWTENSAIAFNDTDATKLLGCAQVSQWFDLGTPVVGFNGTCRIPIVGNAADDIYVVMVARGTINLGSTSDLIVEITVDQN